MIPEQDEELEEQGYFFDDFFVPEDDLGHSIDVVVKDKYGHTRKVGPFFIKRGLSLGDREAAKAKAVQTRVNPKNGQLEVIGFDEGLFQLEVLVKAVKSWPFKDKNNKATEITRQNLRMLQADIADALFKEVMGLMDKEKDSLDFFEKKSEDRS